MSSADSKISAFSEKISAGDKPVGSLSATIKEISSKYFVDPWSLSDTRRNFGGGYDADELPAFDYMGQDFLFVNRETECKQLVTRFGEMDSIRGYGNLDQLKRNLLAPLCIGLSGIGKTRFAHVAVTSLVRKATGLSSPTLEQMLESSNTVTEEIWPDDRSHDKLLRELIFASHESRNIRITMYDFCGATERTVEVEIIIAVLAQWMKQRKLRPELKNLKDGSIVNKLKAELGIFRWAPFLSLTFCEVVVFIIEQSSRAGEIEHTPALIINLDEAQNLRGSLQQVLEIISRPLFAVNCRVFFTITGICTSHFREAIVQSNVSLQPIILPILSETHLSTILGNIFGVEVNQLPENVVNLTKSLGGVSRLLEYFLSFVAKKSTATTVEQIWEWPCTTNNKSLMDIILSVRSHLTG